MQCRLPYETNSTKKPNNFRHSDAGRNLPGIQPESLKFAQKKTQTFQNAKQSIHHLTLLFEKQKP